MCGGTAVAVAAIVGIVTALPPGTRCALDPDIPFDSPVLVSKTPSAHKTAGSALACPELTGVERSFRALSAVTAEMARSAASASHYLGGPDRGRELPPRVAVTFEVSYRLNHLTPSLALDAHGKSLSSAAVESGNLTMWKYGTLALAALLCAAPLSAQVVRLEITSREPMNAGQPAGAAGPFELIRGRIHGEVDPKDPHNAHHPGSRPGAAERARQSRVRRDLRAGQARRSREGLARAPLSGGQSRQRTGDGERRGRHRARQRLARGCHPDRDQPDASSFRSRGTRTARP